MLRVCYVSIPVEAGLDMLSRTDDAQRYFPPPVSVGSVFELELLVPIAVICAFEDRKGSGHTTGR